MDLQDLKNFSDPEKVASEKILKSSIFAKTFLYCYINKKATAREIQKHMIINYSTAWEALRLLEQLNFLTSINKNGKIFFYPNESIENEKLVNLAKKRLGFE